MYAVTNDGLSFSDVTASPLPTHLGGVFLLRTACGQRAGRDVTTAPDTGVTSNILDNNTARVCPTTAATRYFIKTTRSRPSLVIVSLWVVIIRTFTSDYVKGPGFLLFKTGPALSVRRTVNAARTRRVCCRWVRR